MPDAPSLNPLTEFVTFGDFLKYLRRRARLSQRELSIALGYSESQVSRLESNLRTPDRPTLAALFAPALNLEHEPDMLARLLELAARARGEAILEAAPAGPTGAQPPLETSGAMPPNAQPAPAPRDNLPLQLTNFIGRAQPIAEVKRLLQASRLVTLTGPGGTGKTRLALQVAAEVLDEFPDGAWLVELAPTTKPDQVAQAVAQALALRTGTAESAEAAHAPHSGKDVLSLLAEHLGERRLLLVLDNCEHLVEACAALAEQLLRAAPGLRILATSREALGVAGEHSYGVPALPVPEPGQLPALAVVAQSDAVRLFVERAQAVRSDFALNGENAAAVAQICQRLEGIPLALELAAARARALSVEQIAAHLAEHDRLRLLTGGSRGAPRRQQTLRGAIDWSYELLTDEERALLRRLSVFAGGWTLEAAEQVMGAPDVLDWLTQLVAKSLVQSEQPPGQAARFRMLETIREYAQEKLVQAGEEAAARGRHLDFYMALAEQAEPELRGRGQVKSLNRLDRENDNLRGALGWAVKTHDAEPALRLAGALTYFWVIRGYGAEGRRWLEAALHLQPKDASLVPSAWQAKALLGAGWLDRVQDMSASQARLKQAFDIYRRLGDKPGMAYGKYLLAHHLRSQVDYARANSIYQESLDLWMALEDGWGIGICVHYIGRKFEAKADYAQAREQYQRSIHLLREAGDRWELTGPLMDLAELALMDGDAKHARAMLEECNAAHEALGSNSPIRANVLGLLASISAAQGDYDQAEAVALTTLTIPGGPRFIAAGQTRLGQIDYLQGRLAEAQAHFEAGLKIFRELNDQNGMGWVPPWLGCVAYRAGDLDRAQMLIEEGLAIDDPGGYWPELAFALLARGDVARKKGDPTAAAKYYARSLRIILEHREHRDRPIVAERLEGFAKLAGAAQQPARAAKLFGAAEALRSRIGTPIPPVERAEYDAAVALARSQLDPAAFSASWAEGQALSWEQAAAYALEP